MGHRSDSKDQFPSDLPVVEKMSLANRHQRRIDRSSKIHEVCQKIFSRVLELKDHGPDDVRWDGHDRTDVAMKGRSIAVSSADLCSNDCMESSSQYILFLATHSCNAFLRRGHVRQ